MHKLDWTLLGSRAWDGLGLAFLWYRRVEKDQGREAKGGERLALVTPTTAQRTLEQNMEESEKHLQGTRRGD